jgi:hypothetical protein
LQRTERTHSAGPSRSAERALQRGLAEAGLGAVSPVSPSRQTVRQSSECAELECARDGHELPAASRGPDDPANSDTGSTILRSESFEKKRPVEGKR